MKQALHFSFMLINLLLLAQAVKSQSNKVELSDFSVGRKEINCDYKVTLNIDGKLIKPEIKENTFVVPDQIKHAKKISVRVSCGIHTLYFRSLQPRDFIYENAKYTWSVGIDTPPFTRASVHPSIANKVAKVHYITFQPYGYVSTITQVFFPKLYKNKKKKKYRGHK